MSALQPQSSSSRLADLLRAVVDEIVRHAEIDREFGDRLLAVLKAEVNKGGKRRHREMPIASHRGRRAPGVLDPFRIHAEGWDGLEPALAALTVDQLKDIVAEHGMDPSKLAMKWKTPQRLIDLILATVSERSGKGDAFRRP